MGIQGSTEAGGPVRGCFGRSDAPVLLKQLPRGPVSGTWQELCCTHERDKKGWVFWNGRILLRQASHKYGKPVTVPEGSKVPENETVGWHGPHGQDHWFEIPLSLPKVEEETGLFIEGRLFTTRMPRMIDAQEKPEATDKRRFLQKVRQTKLQNVFVLVEHTEFAKGQSSSLLSFYEEECGLKVYHRPIEDYNCPSLETEKSTIEDLDILLRRGENCLVHCWGGSGRTGTVVIGALGNFGVSNPIGLARYHGKSVYLDIAEQEEFLEQQRLVVTQQMVKECPILVEHIVLRHIEELVEEDREEALVATSGGAMKFEDMEALRPVFHLADHHGTGKTSVNSLCELLTLLEEEDSGEAQKNGSPDGTPPEKTRTVAVLSSGLTMKKKKTKAEAPPRDPMRLKKILVKLEPKLQFVPTYEECITFDLFVRLVCLNKAHAAGLERKKSGFPEEKQGTKEHSLNSFLGKKKREVGH